MSFKELLIVAAIVIPIAEEIIKDNTAK